MAAAESGHQFGSIFFGQKGAVAQGQLRIAPSGFLWRRNGGGKPVEVKKGEIESLHWTKVTRGCQLGVRVMDGITTNFIGFRDKDLDTLKAYCKEQYGKEVQELSLATTGRNWGGVALHGRSLMFMVEGRLAFEVPLPDVAQAQQVKDDIMLEFHVDDNAGDERADALVELALHVPAQQKDGREEDNEPPAKKLLDSLIGYTDTGAASADSAVASFSDVHILAPRGRFEVEMMYSQLQLVGQAQDFKIRYSSIQRIFILPKSSTPHTLVVISLDPPIRKGQTYYTHILCQFPTEEDATVELQMTPEMLVSKNEKCGGKLEMSMSGPIHEVFARTLRGLSGAKITRPGGFKNSTQDGYAVRCSYKADDGYLYPLDRAFFYVHKPPMLLPFEDVESVELTRLGGNAVSSKTFDLVVRTKMDTEHQFRGIQRQEWQVLLDFFQAKKLRVERLRETQAGQAGQGARAALGFDDEDDALRRLGGDDDEDDEDEDFDVENNSASGDESSSGELEEENGSEGAEMVDEEGISANAVKKSSKKKDKAPKEKEEKKKKRPPSDDESGEEEEEEKPKPAKKPKAAKEPKPSKDEAKTATGKKPRAKKDPNAPKNALSAFMFFSTAMRDKIKAEMPGISFGEVGKALGERWKAATPDVKAPFEEQAKKDKERYQKAMAAFKAGGSGKAAADDDDGDAGMDE